MWVQVTETRKCWIFLAATQGHVVMLTEIVAVGTGRGTTGRRTLLGEG